jgi:hypothetical protein
MAEFEKIYRVNYNLLILDLISGKANSTKVDTIPDITKVNDKGYYIGIKDNKGNCTVVVEDKNGKEVKRLLLKEWDKNKKYFDGLYGEIPSPPQIIPSSEKSKPTLTSDAKFRSAEKPSGSDIVTFSADSIIFKTENGNIYFSGQLSIENGKDRIALDGSVHQNRDNKQLILLNGVELDFSKAANLILKGKYQIISLSNEEGLKKYGDKAKYGVIEIKSIPPSETNFIEKSITPAWDIKSFLPGKKKDEC